jgi:membrane associated rhomboid family serine protease
MEISITLLIILITVGTSLWAFNDSTVMAKLIFDPIAVTERKQYYRFLTSGFVHADYMHLGFNMLSFYSFGNLIEKYIFNDLCVYGKLGNFVFVLLYITALIISEIPSYLKNKNNRHYLSLGASGGVSAIIFAAVLFIPQMKLGLMFIPIPIPGYIFCFLFLGISTYLDRYYPTKINHMAHIFGALYGVFFIFVATTAIGNIDLIANFMQQVKNPLNALSAFECK